MRRSKDKLVNQRVCTLLSGILEDRTNSDRCGIHISITQKVGDLLKMLHGNADDFSDRCKSCQTFFVLVCEQNIWLGMLSMGVVSFISLLQK